MVDIYKSIYGELNRVEEITDGVWINMVFPTEEEIEAISSKLDTDPDFIKAALDEYYKSYGV